MSSSTYLSDFMKTSGKNSLLMFFVLDSCSSWILFLSSSFFLSISITTLKKIKNTVNIQCKYISKLTYFNYISLLMNLFSHCVILWGCQFDNGRDVGSMFLKTKPQAYFYEAHKVTNNLHLKWNKSKNWHRRAYLPQLQQTALSVLFGVGVFPNWPFLS